MKFRLIEGANSKERSFWMHSTTHEIISSSQGKSSDDDDYGHHGKIAEDAVEQGVMDLNIDAFADESEMKDESAYNMAASCAGWIRIYLPGYEEICFRSEGYPANEKHLIPCATEFLEKILAKKLKCYDVATQKNRIFQPFQPEDAEKMKVWFELANGSTVKRGTIPQFFQQYSHLQLGNQAGPLHDYVVDVILNKEAKNPKFRIIR